MGFTKPPGSLHRLAHRNRRLCHRGVTSSTRNEYRASTHNPPRNAHFRRRVDFGESPGVASVGSRPGSDHKSGSPRHFSHFQDKARCPPRCEVPWLIRNVLLRSASRCRATSRARPCSPPHFLALSAGDLSSDEGGTLPRTRFSKFQRGTRRQYSNPVAVRSPLGAVQSMNGLEKTDAYLLAEWGRSLRAEGWSATSADRAVSRVRAFARATKHGLANATRLDVIEFIARRYGPAGIPPGTVLRSEGWKQTVRAIRALGRREIHRSQSRPDVRHSRVAAWSVWPSDKTTRRPALRTCVGRRRRAARSHHSGVYLRTESYRQRSASYRGRTSWLPRRVWSFPSVAGGFR